MTSPADLPKLWTHEPHDHLVFREGDKVANIDTSATPGFKGKKSDAAQLQPERNERFALLQEMLRAAGVTITPPLLVLQGGHRGKGVSSTRCGRANRKVPAARLRRPHRGRANTTTCGGSTLLPAGHVGVFDRIALRGRAVVRAQHMPPEV
jgi:hypothetical protein